MLSLFTKHPNSLGLTYYEHMKGSFNYSYLLFVGSIKASVHAIFPFLYETSTSDTIENIEKELSATVSRIKFE